MVRHRRPACPATDSSTRFGKCRNPTAFEVAQLGRLQALVDDLARAIGRSVEVDNPQLELLCASAQTGPIDQVRIDAIIDRAPPPGPVPWMLDRNIAASSRPVRLPAYPGFGMLPRICFPIRWYGQLLRYLWLFDEPPAPPRRHGPGIPGRCRPR